MRKLLAALMTVSGLIGLSAVLARPWSQAPARPGAAVGTESREALRPLEADAVSVRLLLGVGDPAVEPWGGLNQ